MSEIVNEFIIEPTKANPSEYGFTTIHDQETLNGSRPDQLPVVDDGFGSGTLYSAFEWRKPERVTAADGTSLWGNYRLWDARKGQGNTIEYRWKKVKTDAERNTRFHFDRITIKMFWDAVLEAIQFGQETGFPLSQNTINSLGRQAIAIAPRWLVKRFYRPGQTLTTVVEIESFLWDTPVPEELIVTDEPQPTEVSWDLVGHSGDTGKCLHGNVEVPGQGGGYRVVATSGFVEGAASDASTAQFFPATNHKKRRDYFVHEVEAIEGQWLWKKMLVKAPRSPKLIKK